MNDMDRLIAMAQVALSVLFLTGYFIVLILFMLGYARIPVDYKEAFAGLLSLMTAGGLSILYFWFQRSRLAGVPDPTTTTTQTTTTATPSTAVVQTVTSAEPASIPAKPTGD